jgi:hypothetical protein
MTTGARNIVFQYVDLKEPSGVSQQALQTNWIPAIASLLTISIVPDVRIM